MVNWIKARAALRSGCFEQNARAEPPRLFMQIQHRSRHMHSTVCCCQCLALRWVDRLVFQRAWPQGSNFPYNSLWLHENTGFAIRNCEATSNYSSADCRWWEIVRVLCVWGHFCPRCWSEWVFVLQKAMKTIIFSLVCLWSKGFSEAVWFWLYCRAQQKCARSISSPAQIVWVGQAI